LAVQQQLSPGAGRDPVSKIDLRAREKLHCRSPSPADALWNKPAFAGVGGPSILTSIALGTKADRIAKTTLLCRRTVLQIAASCAGTAAILAASPKSANAAPKISKKRSLIRIILMATNNATSVPSSKRRTLAKWSRVRSVRKALAGSSCRSARHELHNNHGINPPLASRRDRQIGDR
jgi:hypothetical protein